jgi:hypothetical protein
MFFAFSLSLLNLILFCLQQFGVALGIGAETVLLVAYLHSLRDGMVDDEEKGFARATRRVMDVGLFLIITTGVGIVCVAVAQGQQMAFFSTIFLFKWSLIGIVLFMALANRGTSVTAGIFQGLAAGTWYALFVVHILAPEASWIQLGEFYGIWLAGFMVCWTVLVFALKGKPGSTISTPPVAKSIVQPAVTITPSKPVPTSVPPPAAPKVQKQPLFGSLFKKASAPQPQAAVEVVITPSVPAPVLAPVTPPTPVPAPTPVAVPKPVIASAFVPPPPAAPVVPVVPVAPVVTITPTLNSTPTTVPPPPPLPPKPSTMQAVPEAPNLKSAFSGLHVMPKSPEELHTQEGARDWNEQ